MGGEWVGTGWARDFLNHVIVGTRAIRDIATVLTRRQTEADWTLRDDLAWEILRSGHFHVLVPTGMSDSARQEFQREQWAKNIDNVYRAVDFFLARRETKKAEKG